MSYDAATWSHAGKAVMFSQLILYEKLQKFISATSLINIFQSGYRHFSQPVHGPYDSKLTHVPVTEICIRAVYMRLSVHY